MDNDNITRVIELLLRNGHNISTNPFYNPEYRLKEVNQLIPKVALLLDDLAARRDRLAQYLSGD